MCGNKIYGNYCGVPKTTHIYSNSLEGSTACSWPHAQIYCRNTVIPRHNCFSKGKRKLWCSPCAGFLCALPPPERSQPCTILTTEKTQRHSARRPIWNSRVFRVFIWNFSHGHTVLNYQTLTRKAGVHYISPCTHRETTYQLGSISECKLRDTSQAGLSKGSIRPAFLILLHINNRMKSGKEKRS